MRPPTALSFGEGRFELVERLGVGAMGIVFRVRERRTSQELALKLLRQVSAPAILRFKQEFRALADVVHPNLVPLYELVATDDQWFFTMELVEGVHFNAYIRDPASLEAEAMRAAAVPEPTRELRLAPGPGDPTATSRTPAIARAPRVAAGLDPSRHEPLRAAMLQLADGIGAIHRHGQLHRDLKPSNVMITRGGRLVILDFGVATALAEQHSSSRDAVIGTPAYMAPEQAAAEPLDEASDWYAFGVMLYEALTGVRPFEGQDFLLAKTTGTPPSPSALVSGVPAELDALCGALLARDPRARPGLDEIRAVLGGSTSVGSPSAEPTDTTEVPLVGRERELAVLRSAFEVTTAGDGRVVLLHSRSGMGKTALADAFVSRLERDEAAIVLRGRCYERETVPYKAVDGLIDALTHHIGSLPSDEAWALVPPEIAPLARLFPVLRQLEPVMAAQADELDPREMRRRAFDALRALLRALARRARLVLYLDDLQWGDPDSAALFEAVLRDPMPPVLVLATYRSEAAETSPFLTAFLPTQPDAVSLPVRRLSAPRARTLAMELLRQDPSASLERAAHIAREADGNPFFIAELARHVTSDAGRAVDLDARLSLDDVLASRLGQLAPVALRLLDVIAVAGRPIAQGLVREAAGAEAGERIGIAQLRSAKLIRTSGAGGDDTVECFHDRVREVVTTRLANETCQDIHGRLARVLAAARADPHVLATHYEGAGLPALAAPHHAAAAEAASAAFAFDRAVEWYRRALACELAPERRPALLIALAEALARAGRSAEAAHSSLEAAELAEPQTALELRCRAAQQLIGNGLIERGRAVLEDALCEVGLRPPRSVRGRVASFLLQRLLLRLRGVRFRPRPRHEIEPLVLARLRACWAAGLGFSLIDYLVAGDFQARHLRYALAAGDTRAIARGMALDACFLSVDGGSNTRQAERMLDRALVLAEELDAPESRIWAAAASGVTAYFSGRWRDARVVLGSVVQTLRDPGYAATAWELADVRLAYAWSLFLTGDLRELTARVPEWLREALERSDVHTAGGMRNSLVNFVWLIQDDPAGARRQVEEALERWAPGSFQAPHYWRMLSLVNVALYEDDPAAAVACVTESWPGLRSTFWLYSQLMRVEAHDSRGRAHLLAAFRADDARQRRRHVRDVERAARRLRRDRALPSAGGRADILLAGIALLAGDDGRAQKLYRRAAAQFTLHGMELYAHVARRRANELSTDETAAARIADTDAWMHQQTIVDPAKVTRALAPGRAPPGAARRR